MRRRALLVSLGAGLSLGSGCPSGAIEPTSGTDEQGEPTPTTDDGSGNDGNGSNDGNDGGGDGEPPISSCPSFTDADERVCYSFRGEDAPLNLKPSTQ